MLRSGKTIVCDVGASTIKIGFAGSLKPERVIPNLVAVPRRSKSTHDFLLGNEIVNMTNRELYSFLYPIDQYGMVQNWTALEAILHHALQEIGLDSGRDCKILVAKSFGTTRTDVKTLLDLLFDKFEFAAIAFHDQAALVLYTQGVDTGLVVDLGETMASIVPVYHGFAMPKLNRRLAMDGRSMTQHLGTLLKLRGYPQFQEREDLEVLREIKEQGSYVALDAMSESRRAEATTSLEMDIHLGDGTTVKIGRERFEAPETFFQPELWDSEQCGLSDLVFNTIQQAPIDCRVCLYQNIIICGGSPLIPGLQDRLQQDLTNRYDQAVLQSHRLPVVSSRKWNLTVHAPGGRQFAVFEGAALFADLIRDDDKFWVTKSQFDNHGGMQFFLDRCQIFF